jgi:sterol desaturase/sphingolipid hydroxylase (fatty acid hydroxylase superfamily)
MNDMHRQCDNNNNTTTAHRSMIGGDGGDTLLRLAGAAWFVLSEADEWSWWQYVAWMSIVLAALELLSASVLLVGDATVGRTIPMRGKHLDRFEPLDVAFVVFNKCTTPLFAYHAARAAWRGSFVRFALPDSFGSLLGALALLPVLYVVYDLFYTLFHRALHHRALYRFVHKHHHRQKAPSRGNLDAVNVHPFEFIVGEYTHLLAIFLVGRLLAPVHIAVVVVFILFGGVLASLNHTRFDVKAPLVPALYQVKFHDIHHWYPDSNYGQYTVLWDYLFGWFKPYPNDQRGVRDAISTKLRAD